MQALLVMAACLPVYWLRLGQNGLRSTEGHRAIPAWTILETGEWLPTRMFEAVYMRKPPGIAWAIAASSKVFGVNEFAARVPSALAATLLALMTLWFGRRWFGARWGVYAGLASVLVIGWWAPGRSAEIEALNNLFTAAAAFALVDVVVFQRRVDGAPSPGRGARRAWMALFGAAGFFGAALMKGPSSLPCMAGALAACGVVVGRRALVRDRAAWLWLGAGLGSSAALFALLAWSVARASQANAGAGGAPTGVADKLVFFHLWRETAWHEFIGLVPLTAAGAFPASLALLFPWGGDAKREAASAAEAAGEWGGESGAAPALATSYAVARALAWGFVVSALVYLLVGVSNPRYTMPAGVFAPALAAYVARGAAGGFDAKRARIARLALLGGGRALGAGWLVVLVGGGAWWVFVREPEKGRDSGRQAGVALGASLPDGAEVWADEMVESRPETLWYAQQTARSAGRRVRMRWMQGAMQSGALPEAGTMLLLTEGEGRETERYGEIDGDALGFVARGRAHVFDFVLVRRR